jgi:hypothetical protein
MGIGDTLTTEDYRQDDEKRAKDLIDSPISEMEWKLYFEYVDALDHDCGRRLPFSLWLGEHRKKAKHGA